MKISSAEWEVLRVVWALDRPTSRQIGEVLEQDLAWSASTIKTLLGRLVDKGVLSAAREGRQFVYASQISQREACSAQVAGVLGKICRRQHFGLLEQVLTDLPMTAEELARLEALLLTKKDQVVASVPCNCLPGQCRCERGEDHG